MPGVRHQNGKIRHKNGKIICRCCNPCRAGCGCFGCALTVAVVNATNGSCDCGFYFPIDVLCEFTSKSGTVCTYEGVLFMGTCLGTAAVSVTYDSATEALTATYVAGGLTFTFAGSRSGPNCLANLPYTGGSGAECDISSAFAVVFSI